MSEVSDEEEPRLKVKLTTDRYFSNNKYIVKKELYFYKKPNPKQLVDQFYDDISMTGFDCERVINLDECIDGLYELIVCNISRDWESGWVDDWDWKLIEWRD